MVPVEVISDRILRTTSLEVTELLTLYCLVIEHTFLLVAILYP